MITVSGDDPLAQFRGRLTGRHGLDLVQRHGGRVLVQLPVGVGKSRWIDAITLEAVESGDYDLVVVLCPTRQLIEERGPLRNSPPGRKVVNLRPRPADLCGRRRDAEWRRFEAADLGALGRVETCGPCPHRAGCFWPGQYSKALRQASIVYGTQAHLERSPGFLVSLRSWTGAGTTLTLLDEANFVGACFEQVISTEELRVFVEVLRRASPCIADPGWKHAEWLDLAGMLLDASTEDLQEASWRMPWLNRKWALAVQRVGVELYRERFRFLGYALGHLRFSRPESRQRDENANIRFGVRPWVGDCIVFSGAIDRELTRYRLGEDMASPFADHRFVHPDTRWYNLASPVGTRKYFARHSPQVLDFFAELVARRTAEGKRVLLIAKKCFVPQCRAGLEERFTSRGLDLRVVTAGWSADLLADRRVLPLINYGMVGTNLFEGFDAAFCLTGFYVNESVLSTCLQDLTRLDLRLPVRIDMAGEPRRRRARTADLDHRFYDLAGLVQPALEFQEHNVVVQAAGRVRPFTRPREVITFQMAELPGVVYDAEFGTLAEARRFFGVPSRRESRGAELAAGIAAERRAGKTQAEAAAALGVSERTVRTYERKGGPASFHL